MNPVKLTVRARLLGAFGLLTALVIFVAALSVGALGSEHDAFASFVEHDSERVRLASVVVDAANARAIAARDLVLVTTAHDKAVGKDAVDASQAKLQASLAALKQAVDRTPGISAQERQLLTDFEAVEARYGPVAGAIVGLAMNGRHDEAIAKMNAECRPLLAALIKSGQAYIGFAAQQSAEDVAAAAAAYARNRNLLLAACAVALAAAVALALAITRSLTRALGAEPAALGAAAERVAGGDLRPVPGADRAPTGSVLASLGDMQVRLARVVGQVRSASDSIATGSMQIATANLDLSQRTEEQASNLQQTAASMEQMNSAVRTSADNAQQAAQFATSASAVAAQGGEVVRQVVHTMGDISASSKRIADIIGVIDGIAFQTNILALNAAVEAARAGEQGRGFAVVASEVRSLAQRSAEAAKEIKLLIGQSVDKVEAGARLVNDAGTTMTDIVTQVGRVAGLIGEISSAAAEQTGGIGQVSDAVTQLDQVTQQNAALVEENAAAAGSLKQQAAQLAELVSVFKVGEGAGDSRAASAAAVAVWAPA